MDSGCISVETPSEWAARRIEDMSAVQFSGDMIAELMREYILDQRGLSLYTIHDALMIIDNDMLVPLGCLPCGGKFVFQSVNDVFTVDIHPDCISNKIPCKDCAGSVYYFDSSSLVTQL